MSAVSSSRSLGRIAIASIALCSVSVITISSPGHAQQKPADTAASDNKATASAPVYKPPLRGAPGGRVGGGTRGTGREAFILSVLAPAHWVRHDRRCQRRSCLPGDAGNSFDRGRAVPTPRVQHLQETAYQAGG